MGAGIPRLMPLNPKVREAGRVQYGSGVLSIWWAIGKKRVESHGYKAEYSFIIKKVTADYKF